MPRGDKSKYTTRQKRMAEHIEEGYEQRGTPEEEAERRAWATVNKVTGGGRKRSGSGRGKAENKEPMKKGGRKGGRATSRRPGGSKPSAGRSSSRGKSTGRKSRTSRSRAKASSR